MKALEPRGARGKATWPLVQERSWIPMKTPHLLVITALIAAPVWSESMAVSTTRASTHVSGMAQTLVEWHEWPGFGPVPSSTVDSGDVTNGRGRASSLGSGHLGAYAQYTGATRWEGVSSNATLKDTFRINLKNAAAFASADSTVLCFNLTGSLKLERAGSWCGVAIGVGYSTPQGGYQTEDGELILTSANGPPRFAVVNSNPGKINFFNHFLNRARYPSSGQSASVGVTYNFAKPLYAVLPGVRPADLSGRLFEIWLRAEANDAAATAAFYDSLSLDPYEPVAFCNSATEQVLPLGPEDEFRSDAGLLGPTDWTPVAGPALSIAPASDGVTLSWPTAEGFVLEGAQNLLSPVIWEAVSQPVTIVDTTSTVTLPPSGSHEFFRLSKTIP